MNQLDINQIPIPLTVPCRRDSLAALRAGNRVLLSGTLYTARDMAHKKMIEALDRGERLPFDVRDQILYYVGPTPESPGHLIGSAGPTTSGRMDGYSPRLLREGLAGMIGKGQRSSEVIEAIREHKAVYFTAIGGLGALLAKKIVAVEVVAYPELGPEAVCRLEVRDLPVVVAVDRAGRDLYALGRANYLKEVKNP